VKTGYFNGIIHSINGVFLVLITVITRALTDENCSFDVASGKHGNGPQLGRFEYLQHKDPLGGAVGVLSGPRIYTVYM
jgi:hypothetical protein